jgi:hypothetical protein
MMRSQLLEGFKCESQTENNRRARSRGTLLGSQHCREVKGRVGAPEWGLGRSDKLQLLPRTCTKPTQSG